jgi:hypothetical protein
VPKKPHFVPEKKTHKSNIFLDYDTKKAPPTACRQRLEEPVCCLVSQKRGFPFTHFFDAERESPASALMPRTVD